MSMFFSFFYRGERQLGWQDGARVMCRESVFINSILRGERVFTQPCGYTSRLKISTLFVQFLVFVKGLRALSLGRNSTRINLQGRSANLPVNICSVRKTPLKLKYHAVICIRSVKKAAAAYSLLYIGAEIESDKTRNFVK